MRVAAILGLGSSPKDLEPFQRAAKADWSLGVPANPGDADAVLLFGGDGTIHRHLAELVRLDRPVLIVPQGSGNDFARALQLRSVKDALAAWQRLSEGRGNVRTIDLGVISPLVVPQGLKPNTEESWYGTTEVVPFPKARDSKDEGEDTAAHDSARYSVPGTQHYFCCIAGVGLDGEVARRANQLPRWLRGHGGYALTFPAALLRFTPPRIRLSIAQAAGFANRIDAPLLLAAFANTPAYGGGMKIAPRAQMDDGQLDVCLVYKVGKLRLLKLFPTVYFGRHLGIPEVQYFPAERLRVQTERPLDVYADGEYVCQTPVEVSVARSAMRVVVQPSQTGF